MRVKKTARDIHAGQDIHALCPSCGERLFHKPDERVDRLMGVRDFTIRRYCACDRKKCNM